MNAKEPATAKGPDLRTAVSALRRVTLSARETAIQTGTHPVIVEDGRLLRISAAELAQQEATQPHQA